MNGPAGFSRLRLLHWMELVLVVVCVTGSAVLCNYIVYRHNHRFDLTPERRYTLSGQTMGVLGGIDADLQATVFYGPQDRRSLRDLLDQFSRATPRFHYDLVDLEKNPARAGGMEIKGFGAGVVTYKGRREKVQYCNEDSLLSAIIRLTEPGQKIIRFVQGHGEKEISGRRQAIGPGQGLDDDFGPDAARIAGGEADPGERHCPPDGPPSGSGASPTL